MKRFSPIAAAIAATIVLGACSAGAPTAPGSRALAPSFELSISPEASISFTADTATVPTNCPEIVPVTDTTANVPVADTTDLQVGASGTYAVAYGTPGCFTRP